MFEEAAFAINTSPLFAGCVMILMNIGGKYVMMDIPDNMNSFLAHPWMRKLTIFCIAFVATRNIKTALLLALVFILLAHYLVNEKSKCCLVAAQPGPPPVFNSKLQLKTQPKAKVAKG